MKYYIKLLILGFFISNTCKIASQEKKDNNNSSAVKLTEVTWHNTGCYKIEMEMGTVYFEKDNGVSGFKSFIDNKGNDWIASYLEPGPNGDFRGFPNSVGNFGHAGRDSGSETIIVNGKTEGDKVILESTNGKFTFQYWFFADRVAIKVLKSEGEYNFLLECVAGGTADAEDYFVTADGKKHIPTNEGEFNDFTPEWFYLGDLKSKNVLFLAKTPNDDAPNENHRQIRPNGQHNMDLYSFGRTGKEEKYQVRGMSGNEHICVIGFTPANRPHNEISAMIESFLATPFTSGVKPIKKWSNALLKNDGAWFASTDAREIANSVIQYQSSQGGWPKSTDLARPPLTEGDVPPEGRGRANSLDNDATTVPMEFLAKAILANGDEKYITAFNKGLDYLFAAQYPNGGWPQFWPLRGDEYYSRVTFNDDAMIRVLNLLTDVASGTKPYDFVNPQRKEQAKEAVKRGIDFILKSQIKQNGNLTVWCAQHDENTLKPAWARAYEPPSLSGNESVGIVMFLMSIKNPSTEIINAIEGAVKWLKLNAITGVRLDKVLNTDGRNERILVKDSSAPLLWARFYELETNKPLYLDRDSKFHYKFEEVGYERRSGYDYHGYWATNLLEKEYPLWQAKYAPIEYPKPALIIEAEDGNYVGKLETHSCWLSVMLTNEVNSTHSGSGIVNVTDEVGSYIEVIYNANWSGKHRVTVRYSNNKTTSRAGEMLINGEKVATLKLKRKNGFSVWQTESKELKLKKGKNVIRLQALHTGGLPHMDYIKVVELRDNEYGTLPSIKILEAEDGTYTGIVESHSCWNEIAQIPGNHSGFTGSGLVDTPNEVGSYSEVSFDSLEPGKYILGVRYVHGKPDTRPAEVKVNDIVVNKSLDFTPTGSWTVLNIVTTPIEIKEGKNVIRLSAIGTQGLPNIDHFTLTPEQ